MAVIVVGGHSRNVGKTSVVAGLISAFSRYSWTAVKISWHRHAEVFDGEIRLRAANRHKGLFVKEDVLVYGGTAVGDIDGALRSQRQKRLAKVGSAKG